MEMAISSKLVVTLVTNMVILPLLLSAKVGVLKWVPFLFEGDHRDFNRTWYEDFCNKFSQVSVVLGNNENYCTNEVKFAIKFGRISSAVENRVQFSEKNINSIEFSSI